jgi:hypothetical protein
VGRIEHSREAAAERKGAVEVSRRDVFDLPNPRPYPELRIQTAKGPCVEQEEVSDLSGPTAHLPLREHQ